jgi:hypothetical protein
MKLYRLIAENDGLSLSASLPILTMTLRHFRLKAKRLSSAQSMERRSISNIFFPKVISTSSAYEGSRRSAASICLNFRSKLVLSFSGRGRLG